MQRRLCEMSEAKWSITEAKCLQISHNKYASQRDAISHSMGNLMLSHSAGMHNTDKSIAGICPNKFERAKGSKRYHFASLHYIFSAYLPTHIKFLTEFHRIFFGTTCISFLKFIYNLHSVVVKVKAQLGKNIHNVINSTKRSEFLVFSCYLCLVRVFFTCYLSSTKLIEISVMTKRH